MARAAKKAVAEVTSNLPAVVTPTSAPAPVALGGGLEGADRIDRETMLWVASRLSPDRIINSVKDTADARSRDSIRNNGYIAGAAQVHKDSVIGAQFRLNAKPNWRFLSTLSPGFTEDWATEFQIQVEDMFSLYAESEAHWLDAERRNTLTDMLRLGVGVYLGTGEVIATCEWIRESARPYNTALQMIRSDRLCNPNGVADNANLRRGVTIDDRGKPLAYSIKVGDGGSLNYPGQDGYSWITVPAYKPWGRKQVLHYFEQTDHGQSRGISEMVAVLKNLRMTKRYSEIVLQNAVINATYAAAIESELPSEAITAAMGGAQAGDPAAGLNSLYASYLSALQGYLSGSKNIGIDGAMIPHLFPGTKLTMKNAGTPGGTGTGFEASLLRYIASGLNTSYEALSRDYSKTNYSSGKLATNQMAQAMTARKRSLADAMANDVFALFVEEAMADGAITLPRGVKRDIFYAPLAKEAFCKATWIGSGAGQVDELKETQAALLRIAGGISTHEIECARLGIDWREMYAQRKREIELGKQLGVLVNYGTVKPNGTGSTEGDGGTGPEDQPTGDNQE